MVLGQNTIKATVYYIYTVRMEFQRRLIFIMYQNFQEGNLLLINHDSWTKMLTIMIKILLRLSEEG